MSLSRVVRACAVLFACLASPAVAHAQPVVVLSGQLLDSLTGEPIAGASVFVEELAREARADGEGRFTVPGVAPGTYHVFVLADGYSSRRTEVVAAAGGLAVVVPVDPELHFEDVVSVSARARGQFESFQPTSVLSGQERDQRLEGSLGATLEGQPGVAVRSFGAAPSRPVIRGLDGDRVLILENGQRTGDLSSQSGDHGVTVNPASADRIEVVRGPATLLYGANAIGGLVNVISEDIPTAPINGVNSNMVFDLASAAGEGGGAADVRVGNGTVALTFGGAGRRAGEYRTPLGRVDNSQSRSGLGHVGLSWTGARTYVGGSYAYDDTRYGIPVVEGGVLELTPRRHSFSLRAGGENLEGGFLDGFRATFSVRRYAHEELQGDEVGTRFTNDTNEFEVMASHRPVGRLSGSVGGWFLDRAFDATGAEALAPAVGERGAAAFLYEELSWPHVTLQFGGRVSHTRFEPAGEPERSFTDASGSFGVLLRPAATDDRIVIAASVARAARNPALEELFFYGLHHGNFAVELGNPDLESEQALGLDVSLRWRAPRISGEITWFTNAIDRFIFRNVLDEDTFEAREAEFEARFPGRELVGHAHGEAGEEGHEDEAVAIVDFVGTDAAFHGVELHTDVQLSNRVFAEAGVDYVRASLRDSGEPLPRIPPLRFTGGLRYQDGAFQAGAEVTAAVAQERISTSGVETPTGAYQLVRLFSSYSFETGGVVNTLTARVDNATNELYRNHLSLIKDVVPEMGRNVKLLYTVGF
jgi:iron complex outermembrane receptor protein